MSYFCADHLRNHTKMEDKEVNSQDQILPVDGLGWSYVDGVLHCDGMSLEDLRMSLKREYGHQSSPAHVYSLSTLFANVKKYTEALGPLGKRGVLSYSLKANNNLRVVEALRQAGVTMATTVSGNEILMAMKAGFAPTNIIYNGTGKRRWEVELAIRHRVLLNIDSEFDARLIMGVAKETGVMARCLVRLNPDLEAHTHPYMATALADSKFGVEVQQLEKVLQIVRTGEIEGEEEHVDIEGLHIHVGSAVSRTQVFADMASVAARTLHKIRERGWPRASLINLGGGLNIRLSGGHGKGEEDSENLATPQKLVGAVLPLLPEGTTLLLEPGRSLVATAGVLMTEVLGTKTNGEVTFLVVDAAMTEVIRPALYGAHHPVTHVTVPSDQERTEVDVVGPVCESGDFLARRCQLHPRLPTGTAVVVWATGAYCSSMASSYNMRPHALEVMIQLLSLNYLSIFTESSNAPNGVMIYMTQEFRPDDGRHNVLGVRVFLITVLLYCVMSNEGGYHYGPIGHSKLPTSCSKVLQMKDLQAEQEEEGDSTHAQCLQCAPASRDAFYCGTQL